jgi:uncharacterized protein YaaR (DUF327 family)
VPIIRSILIEVLDQGIHDKGNRLTVARCGPQGKDIRETVKSFVKSRLAFPWAD